MFNRSLGIYAAAFGKNQIVIINGWNNEINVNKF